MNHPNKKIMQKAIDLAKKESSVAALIVKGNEIIAHGITTVKQNDNPFRHAEINAIEKASKQLQSYYLTGCWLYTTFEPCPMCAAVCVGQIRRHCIRCEHGGQN